MTLKSIKVGRWYETNVGIGQAERVGGTFPPSVRMRIVGPVPRGVVNVRPRDVIRELTHEQVRDVEALRAAANTKEPTP